MKAHASQPSLSSRACAHVRRAVALRSAIESPMHRLSAKRSRFLFSSAQRLKPLITFVVEAHPAANFVTASNPQRAQVNPEAENYIKSRFPDVSAPSFYIVDRFQDAWEATNYVVNRPKDDSRTKIYLVDAPEDVLPTRIYVVNRLPYVFPTQNYIVGRKKDVRFRRNYIVYQRKPRNRTLPHVVTRTSNDQSMDCARMSQKTSPCLGVAYQSSPRVPSRKFMNGEGAHFISVASPAYQSHSTH